MRRSLLLLQVFIIPLLASQVTITITPPYFFFPATNTITIAVNVCCAPRTVTLVTATVKNEPVTIVRTLDLVVPKGAYPINVIVILHNDLVKYTTIAPMVLKATPPSVTVSGYINLELGYVDGTIGMEATLQVGNFTPNWNNYVTVTKTVTVTYTIISKETLTINRTITSVTTTTMLKTLVETVTKYIPKTITVLANLTRSVPQTLSTTISEMCHISPSTTTIILTKTITKKEFGIPTIALLSPVTTYILRKIRRK